MITYQHHMDYHHELRSYWSKVDLNNRLVPIFQANLNNNTRKSMKYIQITFHDERNLLMMLTPLFLV